MPQHVLFPIPVINGSPLVIQAGELDGDLHAAEKHVPEGVVAAVDDLMQDLLFFHRGTSCCPARPKWDIQVLL